MSTNIWVSTTGDWSNTAGWHNADVPDSTDSALLCDNGGVAVIAGLSQGAIDLDKLMIVNFPYAVGSSGGPLVIGATTFQILGSTGNVYIQNDSGSANTWFINSSNRTAAAVLTGSATYTRVVVVRGAVTITGGTVTLLQVGYDKNQDRDASVTLSGCTVGTIEQSGGTINASTTAIGVHHKSSGEFNYTGNPSGVYGIVYHGNGRFNYKAQADGTPNIEDVVTGGGMLNFANVVGPCTVDNLTAMPGAKYIKNPQLVTVTSELIIENKLAHGPQP